MMKYEIDVPEQHEQLPSLYWLPKLHKENLRLQVHCCFQQMHYKTTLISSLLTSCFITIILYLIIINNNYCDSIYNHSRYVINCCWIINNSTEV